MVKRQSNSNGKKLKYYLAGLTGSLKCSTTTMAHKQQIRFVTEQDFAGVIVAANDDAATLPDFGTAFIAAIVRFASLPFVSNNTKLLSLKNQT